MATLKAASPTEAAQLQAMATKFEAYAAGVSASVAARYQFWATLNAEARRMNLSLSDALPASILEANRIADQNARLWATAVVALDRRQAELAGWTDDEGQTIKLGVAVAGTLPKSLGAWPIIPILIWGARGAFAVGTWLLADSWLTASQIDAEAQRTHAQTKAAAVAAIAKAAAYGPQYAQMVSDAIVRANESTKAPPQGVLSSLAEALRTGVEAVKSTGGLGVALLIGLLLWNHATGGDRGRA